MLKGLAERTKSKLKNRHISEILKGSSIALLFRGCGLAAAYLFTYLVSSNYGPRGMGFYSLSLTVLTICGMFGALGMQTSILRYVGQSYADDNLSGIKGLYRNVVSLTLPVSVMLGAALFLLSGKLAEFVFHNPSLTEAFKTISVVVPFFIVNSVTIETIRGMKVIALSEGLRNFSTPFFSILIFYIFNRVYHAVNVPVLTLSGAVAATCIVSVVWIQGKFRTFTGEARQSLTIQELLRTSLPMMMTAFSSLLMGHIATIMIGIYLDAESVGVYSIALKIASVTGVILVAINTIAAPKFSEFYWSGNIEELRRVVRFSSKLMFLFSFPVVVVIAAVPEQLLGLFGKGFVSGKYALLFMTAGQFVNSVSGSVGYLLNMTGNQNVFRNIMVAAAVVNIALNAVLIPVYGINGAAVAMMVSLSMWNLCGAFYIKRKLQIQTIYLPVLQAR